MIMKIISKLAMQPKQCFEENARLNAYINKKIAINNPDIHLNRKEYINNLKIILKSMNYSEIEGNVEKKCKLQCTDGRMPGITVKSKPAGVHQSSKFPNGWTQSSWPRIKSLSLDENWFYMWAAPVPGSTGAP
jgi:hypothetical protein